MAEKYAYITWEERQIIEEMIEAGARVLDLALHLGRHTNVIYNELHRGQFEKEDGTFGYSAQKAQDKIDKGLHARGWRRDKEKHDAARERELENRRLGIRTRKVPTKKNPVNITVKIAKPDKETAPAAPETAPPIETRAKDTETAARKLQNAAAGATEHDNKWWVEHIFRALTSFNHIHKQKQKT